MIHCGHLHHFITLVFITLELWQWKPIAIKTAEAICIQRNKYISTWPWTIQLTVPCIKQGMSGMLRNCGFCSFQNKNFELRMRSHNFVNKLGTSRSKYIGGPRLLDIRLSYNPRFRTLRILVPNPSFVRRIRTFVHSWRTNISSYRTVAMSDWIPKCILWIQNAKKADPSVAAWSRVWVWGRWLAGLAGSNPAGAWMSVSCQCCVLSGTCPCDGLITRPDSPTKCNHAAPKTRRPRPTRAVEPWKENAATGTRDKYHLW